MKKDDNMKTNMKELEYEINILKQIISVQKKTIDRLINQYISGTSNNSKDSIQ